MAAERAEIRTLEYTTSKARSAGMNERLAPDSDNLSQVGGIARAEPEAIVEVPIIAHHAGILRRWRCMFAAWFAMRIKPCESRGATGKAPMACNGPSGGTYLGMCNRVSEDMQ
jgi:hypothetical protein